MKISFLWLPVISCQLPLYRFKERQCICLTCSEALLVFHVRLHESCISSAPCHFLPTPLHIFKQRQCFCLSCSEAVLVSVFCCMILAFVQLPVISCLSLYRFKQRQCICLTCSEGLLFSHVLLHESALPVRGIESSYGLAFIEYVKLTFSYY